MIKWIVIVAAGAAFVTGVYVGSKVTIKVADKIMERKSKKD